MGVRTGTRTYLTGGDHASQAAGKQATSDERSTERLDTLSFWLAEEFGGVPYDERSGSWNPMVGPEDAPDPDSVETAAPWYQEVQFDPALTDEQLERIEARALELGIDTEWPHEEWDQVYLEDIEARDADGGWDGWRRREWERFHPPTVGGLLDAAGLSHGGFGESTVQLLGTPTLPFFGTRAIEPSISVRSWNPQTRRFLERYAAPVMAESGIDPGTFAHWRGLSEELLEASVAFLENLGRDPFSDEFAVDYDALAKRLWKDAQKPSH